MKLLVTLRSLSDKGFLTLSIIHGENEVSNERFKPNNSTIEKEQSTQPPLSPCQVGFYPKESTQNYHIKIL